MVIREPQCITYSLPSILILIKQDFAYKYNFVIEGILKDRSIFKLNYVNSRFV